MDRGGGTVLTIGHSNHTLEVFLALLARHRVSVLADVRSAPDSRFNPHFNREPLAAALETAGLGYVYLGRELGGRSDDRSCYENGRIRYDRLARTARFRAGLERVAQGAPGRRLALMCAEREPLRCHRTLLVGRALDDHGVDVAHILPDGGLESHRSAMDRLLAAFDLAPDGDLFRRQQPRDELVAEAIARQAARVGHRAEGRIDSVREKRD